MKVVKTFATENTTMTWTLLERFPLLGFLSYGDAIRQETTEPVGVSKTHSVSSGVSEGLARARDWHRVAEGRESAAREPVVSLQNNKHR